MKPKLFLLLLLPAAAFGAKMEWPILPDMPAPASAVVLDFKAIADHVQTEVGPTEKVVLSAPEAGAAPGTAGEVPPPVQADFVRYPIITLSDHAYTPVPRSYVPVLVDWFEAVLKSADLTPEESGADGLTAARISRLMRVFAGVRMHLKAGTEKNLPPAIGSAWVHFNEDWGRYKKGYKYNVVVIGTDEGWIAIDPFTRRARPLVKHDPRWVMELLVM